MGAFGCQSPPPTHQTRPQIQSTEQKKLWNATSLTDTMEWIAGCWGDGLTLIHFSISQSYQLLNKEIQLLIVKKSLVHTHIIIFTHISRHISVHLLPERVKWLTSFRNPGMEDMDGFILITHVYHVPKFTQCFWAKSQGTSTLNSKSVRSPRTESLLSLDLRSAMLIAGNPLKNQGPLWPKGRSEIATSLQLLTTHRLERNVQQGGA
jgi:hypothetical protein